jgi:hypothetical protein
MFVEDQLFPWYPDWGICGRMCGVSQIPGFQQLFTYNCGVSRIAGCCSSFFTLWVLTPHYKMQGLGNSSIRPDYACLHRTFFLLCYFSPFRVIPKEILVIISSF